MEMCLCVGLWRILRAAAGGLRDWVEHANGHGTHAIKTNRCICDAGAGMGIVVALMAIIRG